VRLILIALALVFLLPAGASAAGDPRRGEQWNLDQIETDAVTGIAIAATGHGVGVASVAPGAKVLPVRVLDDSGGGESAILARGIDNARDRAGPPPRRAPRPRAPRAAPMTTPRHAAAPDRLARRG
jgi:hypothetical protein